MYHCLEGVVRIVSLVFGGFYCKVSYVCQVAASFSRIIGENKNGEKFGKSGGGEVVQVVWVGLV